MGLDTICWTPLKRNKWNFAAETTELTIIQAKAKPALLEEFSVHQALHEEILGRRIDYKSIRFKDSRFRLVYISWIVDFLQKNYDSAT